MSRSLVLKRLSSSDLTFFKYHFERTSGAKQKALNLDRSVFIDELYPALPELAGEGDGRIPIDLHIYGPGLAGLHNLQRKILKQQKNWRLDGEFIYDPETHSDRYHVLKLHDYALIEFSGNTRPTTARIVLVAEDLEEDRELKRLLEGKYGTNLTQHRAMTRLEIRELAESLAEITLDSQHPVWDFVDEHELESVAQGSVDAVHRIMRHRASRGVSQAELDRAKRAAEKNGRHGEELLAAWLGQELLAENLVAYNWVSDHNAISPFDFTIQLQADNERRVDAKSTNGPFSRAIYISFSELQVMADRTVPYDIYRLYEIDETRGKLRVCKNCWAFAFNILEAIGRLPVGVSMTGIAVSPDSLVFGDEIQITILDKAE